MTQPFALALSQLPDPPFRRVLFKSLFLTIIAYAGCGVLAWYGFGLIPEDSWSWVPWDWLATTIEWGIRAVVIFLLIVLFPAVATLFISLFLDEIAQAVDARHYGSDPPGRETPLGDSLALAARFAGALIVFNLAVLPLYLLLFWIPFVPVIIFYGLNGYLLGREYFELVAQRHVSPETIRILRKNFKNSILWRGVVIAVLLVIPVVNFVTPLFATAWMAHVFKRLEAKAKREVASVG